MTSDLTHPLEDDMPPIPNRARTGVILPTEADPVRVVQGDCLDVLRRLPDDSVDAVITDPPYNVGLRYAGDTTNDRKNDYMGWCREWFGELRRVCRGPMAISVGQSNLSLWATIAPPDWWLAWWKPAAMGRCVVGFNNWEPIAVYGKPAKAGCDVIRATIRPDPSLQGHPCPKPLEWGTQQVKMFARPSGLILDPFAGSGTTGLAALAEGRRCLMIEKEPAYCDIIRRRLAGHRPSGTTTGSGGA